MVFLIVSLVCIIVFHLWLYAWYFPKHCLSDRKVTLGERYKAFFIMIKQKIRL